MLDRIMQGSKTIEGKAIAVLLAVALAFMAWSVPSIKAFAADGDDAASGQEEVAELVNSADDIVADDESIAVGNGSGEAIVVEDGDGQNDALLGEDDVDGDIKAADDPELATTGTVAATADADDADAQDGDLGDGPALIEPKVLAFVEKTANSLAPTLGIAATKT